MPRHIVYRCMPWHVVAIRRPGGPMSRNQRHALDAKLREAPRPPGPLPVDRMRAGFAAFMGAFPVPADVRRTPTELAGRPAVLVEPEGDAQPGTILYFH